MNRGAFITLEGTEGVGKSSNLARIEQHLDELGIEVLVTREPGGTPFGEQVREWILNAEHGCISAEVEAMLMFAARGYHLDNVIRPALTAGRWVICDRFTDATYAYQGGGRGVDPAFLDALRKAVHADLNPDLTLLFDAPVDIGRSRIAYRAADHFEREGREFFERVRDRYLAIAASEPSRFRIIDATASLEEVQTQVSHALRAFVADFEAGLEGAARHA
jgi:dTMP kinase